MYTVVYFFPGHSVDRSLAIAYLEVKDRQNGYGPMLTHCQTMCFSDRSCPFLPYAQEKNF